MGPSARRSSISAAWHPVVGILSKPCRIRWRICRMRLNIIIGVRKISSIDAVEECRMKKAECRNKTVGGGSFVILLATLFLLLPSSGFGQFNRWLFVLDTSFSMRDRTKGVADVTRDLLTTAMHGQLHRGDSIGIWTFNDRLHAGEVPLQFWTPEDSKVIAQRSV